MCKEADWTTASTAEAAQLGSEATGVQPLLKHAVTVGTSITTYALARLQDEDRGGHTKFSIFDSKYRYSQDRLDYQLKGGLSGGVLAGQRQAQVTMPQVYIFSTETQFMHLLLPCGHLDMDLQSRYVSEDTCELLFLRDAQKGTRSMNGLPAT